MDEQAVLADLVAMSRELGKPENDYVILGEGNTSAKIDDEFFFVKASGKYLANADENTFVKVKLKEAVAILDRGELTDEEIKDALFAACADPQTKLRPSIETTFHSFLLTLPGVNFVGHTHATAILALMCSSRAEEIIRGRICPDEIVYCGIEPAFMDYVDPGVELGRKIRETVYRFMDKHGCAPKEILIRNHGIIAIGATAHEVEAITAMACKVARILAGAHTFGGVRYMTQINVDRIYTRPDEACRREQFRG
ncbi:MAG: class II aldolase/adducin family protein [Armatimonadetes bacterium]|nr:class II aldolase/adducin family protein [Armatimonadota bacterium]